MAKKPTRRIGRFLHFVQHGVWQADLVPATRLRGFGVEALRVLHLVFKGAKDDQCGLRATALTYSTLMAMVPFFVVLFAISGAIGFTSIEASLLEWSKDIPQVQEFVRSLIDMVDKVNMGTLGSFGGVVFIYIVLKLLNGIEESFNQIWGVKSSRKIADKVRNYLSVLVIAPILMLAANYLSIRLVAFSGLDMWFGPVLKAVPQLVPTLILTLAFVAVFMFIPNTRVSFRAALTGGFVSAFLCVLLQILMVKLGIGVTRMSKIYGTFAYIPIFLFWLQMSWSILLFGAELAFAIQHRETYAEERRAARASMLSRLWVALATMREAVRVFQGPEPGVDEIAFARANNIPIRLMNEVVDILEKAGLVGFAGEDDERRLVLLQAPEHVTARRIFDLLVSDGASPADLGLARVDISEEVLSTLENRVASTLDAISLRRFAKDDAEEGEVDSATAGS